MISSICGRIGRRAWQDELRHLLAGLQICEIAMPGNCGRATVTIDPAVAEALDQNGPSDDRVRRALQASQPLDTARASPFLAPADVLTDALRSTTVGPFHAGVAWAELVQETTRSGTHRRRLRRGNAAPTGTSCRHEGAG
jgi:hypothetical protein